MLAPNVRGAEFWNGPFGRGWVSHQAIISDVFTSVTQVSIAAAGAEPGDHVVDIGCGTGDTLLEFARIVGRDGAALGVDISAPMLDLAKRRALAAGFTNVSCDLADAATYGFTPRWADLVYSRFGVMFFDEPLRAFANIRTGMKPSGRLRFACFRTMPESPWFHLPIAAARPHLPTLPAADPLAPGMFSFAQEERVREILDGAGFHDVVLQAQDVPMHVKDIEQSMSFIMRAGPLPALLEHDTDEQQAKALEAVRYALAEGIKLDVCGLHVGIWLVSALA